MKPCSQIPLHQLSVDFILLPLLFVMKYVYFSAVNENMKIQCIKKLSIFLRSPTDPPLAKSIIIKHGFQKKVKKLLYLIMLTRALYSLRWCSSIYLLFLSVLYYFFLPHSLPIFMYIWIIFFPVVAPLYFEMKRLWLFWLYKCI